MQIEFVKTTTERPFVVFNAIIDTITKLQLAQGHN